MNNLVVRPKRRESLVMNYVVLSLLLVFTLGPIVVLVFNSFKTRAEIGKNPLGLPTELHWENYSNAWKYGNFSTTTRNSVILVTGTVTGTLFFSGMAAYSLAKLNLPGSMGFMVYLLIVSTLPSQLFLVPLYFLWRTLGLVNTLFGLIVIYVATGAPFAIFLLRSYMLQIPNDFQDVARVDGANEWQIFVKVIVPLSWPGFLTVGLLSALGVWNEFFFALVFITKPKLFTVITSYYNFTTRFSRDWSLTSAAAVMMIIPVLVIFLSLQRRFIAGITGGGLKG